MERVAAAIGAAADHGDGAILGEILWQEVRILGYISSEEGTWNWYTDPHTGWAKYMEWKYPVEIVVSNPGTFKLAGAIEAAATL